MSAAIPGDAVAGNKRLDDIVAHLVDQGRRIDERNKRIDETNKRIDKTNERRDLIRTELAERMESIRADLTNRMDVVRGDLTLRNDETNRRLDIMGNKFEDRLSRLYEVIVRRDEHAQVIERVIHLERDVAELKRQAVA